MQKRYSFKITAEFFLYALFLLYFCNRPYIGALLKLIGKSYITLLYTIPFFILLFFCLLTLKEWRYVRAALLVYFVVIVLFAVTMLIHPEYSEWFAHPSYGILPAFLSPQGAIWALLVSSLLSDDRKIYSLTGVTAWVLFIFNSLMFLASFRRGYWQSYDLSGAITRSEYSLDFGYEMLFPAAWFAAKFYLEKQKRYLILYGMVAVMVLLSGSRGALVWIAAALPVMVPFKWSTLSKRKRAWFVAFIASLLAAVAVVYIKFEAIIIAIAGVFDKFGLSSRTLRAFVSGSFSDGNGREEIYEMAIELIKTGGPFGRGVYGDRYYIGRFFRWGYSHNLFLELLVTFGYVGGPIVILCLFIGVVKAYTRCFENHVRQMLFVAYAVTSCKLMFSYSFWYVQTFWVMIAFMLRWNRKRTSSVKITEYYDRFLTDQGGEQHL